MPYRILLRRDSSAKWIQNDPVLMLGEPGYETDTRKLKIGDGQTPWSSLRYYGGGEFLNIDGNFSINPSKMPTADSTYTKRVLLNPFSGVFAWEDNDRVKLPNYTKSQRNSLPNKMVGDMIWQTDAGNSGIRVFDGTNWLALQTTID